MPNNIPPKTQILSDLNIIANLAKTGDTKEIVSLIDRRIESLPIYYKYLMERGQYISTSLPSIFPIDRKDILIKFFKRMDNDITGNTLHYLFDIHEAIDYENNPIGANGSLEKLKANGIVLYSIESSILNLKDFGASYRSFDIWLNELNNLLVTFNLKDNKPRINELLSYIKEANVSYFKSKTNMLIGSFFYSLRTENEMDGAILYNGQHINITKYPNFVKKYLETNKVASISIDEWNRRKQEDNNVVLFGYDKNKDYFMAPYIPAGTFISNPIGHITVGTKQITPKQGDYEKDQIVNIRGHLTYNGDRGIGLYEEDNQGVLFISGPKAQHWAAIGHNAIIELNKITMNFDASRVVKTGDRVMPRTVFENLYVIISEEFLK